MNRDSTKQNSVNRYFGESAVAVNCHSVKCLSVKRRPVNGRSVNAFLVNGRRSGGASSETWRANHCSCPISTR